MNASGRDDGTAMYVYGVVAGDDSSRAFDAVAGIEPADGVVLVREGRLAAVASRVPLAEFGQAAIERHLREPAWLEEKVRRHNNVLQAAVGKTTVLPFRFGAIYTGEEHVREMLAERSDLVPALDRLRGKVELGVKGFVDVERVRRVRAAGAGAADEAPTTGAGYMRKRQLERELDQTIRRLIAEWGRTSHDVLASCADEARANALRQAEENGGEMFLNGAYLVATVRENDFQSALNDLRAKFGGEGADYELTGPWPPYNFADEEEDR